MPAEVRYTRENRAGGVRCRETTGMIRSYVDGTIRDRDLHRLIAHIRGCPDCYSELETAFMVDRAVHLLNEDTGQSYDLRPLLEEDLGTRARAARRRGRLGLLHTWIVLVTVLLVLFLLLDLTGIFHITTVF